MSNPIPPDIKVVLKDGDYAPDYETLQKTYWVLCRNTSVAYISRMTEMLEVFTQGFHTYVSKRKNPGLFGEYSRWNYECVDGMKKGLARLRKADHSGFKLIRGSMDFRIPFSDRVSDLNFDDLGYRGQQPGVALWAWMEKVLPMSIEIESALWGMWSYPTIDVGTYHFPAQIGGYPLGENKFIQDGNFVPVTGVWQAISLKGSCPNFLIRGQQAPQAKIPILRTDSPAWYDDIAKIQYPAQSRFDLGDFPTTWQLMWADDRWKNGREPLGEYEYIDGPDTQLPLDPPVALRDPPKLP